MSSEATAAVSLINDRIGDCSEPNCIVICSRRTGSDEVSDSPGSLSPDDEADDGTEGRFRSHGHDADAVGTRRQVVKDMKETAMKTREAIRREASGEGSALVLLSFAAVRAVVRSVTLVVLGLSLTCLAAPPSTHFEVMLWNHVISQI